MDGVPFLFNFFLIIPRHTKNPDSVNCRGFMRVWSKVYFLPWFLSWRCSALSGLGS